MECQSSECALRFGASLGGVRLCYLAIVNQNVRALCLAADKIMRRSNYQNKGIGWGGLDTSQIQITKA